jgi:RimJ/RimL family protein N-acetyltransferase
MTLHTGRVYSEGTISLGPAQPQTILDSAASSDVAENIQLWLPAAMERDDIYDFSIYNGDQLVGQIFLHDIDWTPGESLVGYHLFQPDYRGKGIGTKALELLKAIVTD